MRRPSVLVVEDQKDNLRLIDVVLRSAGYDVRLASDADAALTELRRRRPSMLLMDLQLPGMDGLELTRLIKGDPATGDIPIVAYTAYAMPGDAEQALAAGCDDYLAKPAPIAALLEKIAKYADQTRAPSRKRA